VVQIACASPTTAANKSSGHVQRMISSMKPRFVAPSRRSSSSSSRQNSHHTPAAAAGPRKVISASSSSHSPVEQLQLVQSAHQQHVDAVHLQRRSLLLGVAGCVAASWLQQLAPVQAAAVAQFDLAAVAADLVPAVLQLENSPDQSKYDPAVSRQTHPHAGCCQARTASRLMSDVGFVKNL
jgi:hypothetical protein